MSSALSALFRRLHKLREGIGTHHGNSNLLEGTRTILEQLIVIDLTTRYLRKIRPREHYAVVSHVWADDGQVDLIDFIVKAIDKYQVNTPTSVWIDTLCIDEADDAAKAFWVPRMGDIYASASRTFLALPGI